MNQVKQRAVAAISELATRSKVREIGRSIGVEISFVRRFDELQAAEPADHLEGQSADHRAGPLAVVIVDLHISGCDPFSLIRAVKESHPGCLVLCFFSHVERERELLAKSAGADLVLPRSKFFGELPEQLKSILLPGTG